MSDPCVFVVYGSRDTGYRVYDVQPTFEDAWVNLSQWFFEDRARKIAIQKVPVPGRIDIKRGDDDTRIFVNPRPSAPTAAGYSIPEYKGVSIRERMDECFRVDSSEFYEPSGKPPTEDIYILYRPREKDPFGTPQASTIGLRKSLIDPDEVVRRSVSDVVESVKERDLIPAATPHPFRRSHPRREKSITDLTPLTMRRQEYTVSSFIRVLRWSEEGKVVHNQVIASCKMDAQTGKSV